MKIAVIGTGSVGRTLAGTLETLGHQVTIGTRDIAATLARDTPDQLGTPPFALWHADRPEVGLATFAEAAADGELVVNATSGLASLEALSGAGAANLAGKVLVDVANPLDYSQGFPPGLDPVDSDSLGERIQRAFPEARVVKTLCTVNTKVMVDPARVGGGEHTIFLSGDDAEAKAVVGALLAAMGWRDIIDLGGIRTARGQEMLMRNWLNLLTTLGTADFNIKVVR